MSNRDDAKRSVLGVISFDEGQWALSKQPFAWLILPQSVSGNRKGEKIVPYELRKVQFNDTIKIFEAEFPLFGMYEHTEEQESLASPAQELLCRF
jgi:hypothetical protein